MNTPADASDEAIEALFELLETPIFTIDGSAESFQTQAEASRAAAAKVAETRRSCGVYRCGLLIETRRF
jgi:hypothetical protein